MVSCNLVHMFGSSLMFLRIQERLEGAKDLTPMGGIISGTIAEYAGAPVAVAIDGIMMLVMASSVAAYLPRVRQLEQ